MHALHLPPRHLWLVTFVAALLTFVVMGLLVATPELGSGGGPAGTAPPPAQVAETSGTTAPAGAPVWVRDPLASPLQALGSVR